MLMIFSFKKKKKIHSMFQLKHNKVSCCKKKNPDEVETMNIILYFIIANKIIKNKLKF